MYNVIPTLAWGCVGEDDTLFEFLLIWCDIRFDEFNPTAKKIEYEIKIPFQSNQETCQNHVKVVVNLPAGFLAGGAYSFLADVKWDCSLWDDNKPYKETNQYNMSYFALCSDN